MADEELRKLFASNLTHYLQLNGYNQADLARHMHVSTATTAKWCTGQTMPRIDKIQSICNWLGIDKAALLDSKPVQTDVHPIRKSDLLDNHTTVHTDGQSDVYYLNPETAKAAQKIFDDPNYRMLFDAASDARPEDLQMAAEMLRRFKEARNE